jgi:hypothetical protein
MTLASVSAQEGAMSTIQVQVQRFSVVSSKPFEIILEQLDAQIGHPDMAAFTKAVAAAESYAELETIVQDAIGSSGLMEFTRFNLGEIIRKKSGPGSPRILRLVVGNPRIASNHGLRRPVNNVLASHRPP